MEKERIILHADLNHCYAQIEEMKYPELRKVPMCVGGSEESRHGIILAKNDLAKTYKIKTRESLRDAYKKCPNLLIIHPNYEEYIYYTNQVKDIYREYTDKVESYGLDEAWIDVTDSIAMFGSPAEIAIGIQLRVLSELGLTISIGVSWNKIFSKFGSDLNKKMGLSMITKENYKDIVWSHPVEDLFYVGRATKRKLNDMYIKTIGQLAQCKKEYIRIELGKMGELIWYFANGYDQSDVALTSFERDVKSVGNSITAIHDLNTYEEAKNVFYVLAESVASRLRDHNLRGYVISISLRNTNLQWVTRQRKIDTATNICSEIMYHVVQLLKSNYDFKIPLRGIGISVSKLVVDSPNVQLNLFIDEESRHKEKELDIVIDNIRKKHGFDKIKRCCFLLDKELTNFNPKDDHVIHPESYF